MALPEAQPRDIGHDPMLCHQPQTCSVQTGVSSWIRDGACLTSAIDDLIASPTSLEQVARATFCVALHTDAAPEQLLQWLHVNLSWTARALEWKQCHKLYSSAPANDGGIHVPTESVVLITTSVQADAAQHDLVEQCLVKVLVEVFKSPVECYVTCPGPIPLFQGRLPDLTAESADDAQHLLRQFGVAVLPGCMSAAVLDLWRAQVAQQVELLEGLLAKQGISLQDNSIFTFREIAARGLHRFDARLDAGPLWQQPTAQKLRLSLRDAPWVPLIRDMLGDNVTTITSAVYSRPGADAQEWHSDGPPSAEADQPYAICVFVPLLQLDQATGSTQFWPGSHVCRHLLGFGPAANVLETAVDAVAGAGDAVLYDYRVLHRGLPNTCEALQRDLLQVVYHTKGYQERRNYSANSLLKESQP